MLNSSISSEVVHYIRQARKAGLTDVVIRDNLLAAGWSRFKVSAAFHYLKPGRLVRARVRSKVTQPTTSNPRTFKLFYIGAPLCIVLIGVLGAIAYSQFIIKGKQIFNASIPLLIAKHALTGNTLSEHPAEVTGEYVDSGIVQLAYGSSVFGVKSFTADFAGSLLVQGSAYELLGTMKTAQNDTNTSRSLDIRGQGTHVFANLDTEITPSSNGWVHLVSGEPVHIPASELLVDIKYSGLVQNGNGQRELSFDARLNTQVFMPILSVLTTNPIFFGKLEIPRSVLDEVMKGWIQDSELPAHFRVGLVDRQLHTLEFETNVPSVSHILKQAAGSASVQSSDSPSVLNTAQGVKDALSLYQKDFGGYPANFKSLIPKYLPVWPASPVETSCSSAYQSFVYTPEGAPAKKRGVQVHPLYNITFCLPQDAGSLKAGIAILTPTSLLTTTKCPGQETTCFVPTLSVVSEQSVPNLYGARLKVKMNFQTSVVKKLVRLPEDYTDIIDIVPSGQEPN